jgi:hypothetical protein
MRRQIAEPQPPIAFLLLRLHENKIRTHSSCVFSRHTYGKLVCIPCRVPLMCMAVPGAGERAVQGALGNVPQYLSQRVPWARCGFECAVAGDCCASAQADLDECSALTNLVLSNLASPSPPQPITTSWFHRKRGRATGASRFIHHLVVRTSQ